MTKSDDEKLAAAVSLQSAAIIELVTAVRGITAPGKESMLGCLDRAEAAAREAVVVASGVDKGSLREEPDIVSVTTKRFSAMKETGDGIRE